MRIYCHTAPPGMVWGVRIKVAESGFAGVIEEH